MGLKKTEREERDEAEWRKNREGLMGGQRQ